MQSPGNTAPFHTEIAFGPVGGHAVWRKGVDGVKIRIGLWPMTGARGTVLMFPGRTEYIEKYGHVATAMQERGYAVASVDWRGQGLADRIMQNPLRGHVGTFQDYQHDVTAFMNEVRAQNLPEPYFLIAHSMGGAIGLRALMDGLPVKAAAFSAPMWGIQMASVMRPIARFLSSTAMAFGLGEARAPGTHERAFILEDSFEGNTLTRDPDMYARMADQIRAVPALELGGPSLQWLGQALKDGAALQLEHAPNVPCLTFLGDNERIVCTDAIRSRMDAWPSGTLEMVPAAEHEVLMDTPEKRGKVLTQTADFFDTQLR